jgi:hypothetical protein
VPRRQLHETIAENIGSAPPNAVESGRAGKFVGA